MRRYKRIIYAEKEKIPQNRYKIPYLFWDDLNSSLKIRYYKPSKNILPIKKLIQRSIYEY